MDDVKTNKRRSVVMCEGVVSEKLSPDGVRLSKGEVVKFMYWMPLLQLGLWGPDQVLL